MNQNLTALPEASQVRKDTVMIRLDIIRKPGRVEFNVMATPAPLWQVLPGRPKYIGESISGELYCKRFDFKHLGCEYEFYFYLQPGLSVGQL